jgi:arginine N-succinyltransferase
MYLLRSVELNDLDALYELSQLVTFINLPNDKKIIKDNIITSVKSFKNPSKELEKNYYFFVLEDLNNQKIVGTCMIHGKHGTEDEPHYYLTVGQEHKYCQTINTGFVHGTLKLGIESNGYTEIGGLILHPDYRGRPEKLGKMLSFVRFLYLGMNKNKFTPIIHSELMPPLDSKGNSPLWEAIGRKFMNMDYHSADILSRSNKEFILNLFPSETIYVPLLRIQARNAIGRVGKDTLPVKKMLEKIGFKYVNEIDPFDGGPHYRCAIDEISLIKTMIVATIQFSDQELKNPQNFLISIQLPKYSFSAIAVKGELNGTQLIIEKNQLGKLKIEENTKVNLIKI